MNEYVSVASIPMQRVAVDASYWQTTFEVLQESLTSEPFRAAAIIKQVALANGITKADILGANRARRFSHPRQDAMRIIREQLQWSYPQIAERFRCDHTTVMYAVKKSRARQYEKDKA